MVLVWIPSHFIGWLFLMCFLQLGQHFIGVNMNSTHFIARWLFLLSYLRLNQLFLGLSYWKSIGLEIILHKHIDIHKGIWTMFGARLFSFIPCLALYCSFSTWFTQTIWDNSYLIMDRPCRLITILFLLVLHFYDYEQFQYSTFNTSILRVVKDL